MELSPTHKEAWINFFVSHALVTREIDRRLAQAGVVSLEVYDVLLNLEDATDRRLKMSSLADAVLLSRSGLTRLVDRLERDGLIERQGCASDRRVQWAVLTDLGYAERCRAWPVYREAIADLFAARMSESEARTLAEVLGRFVPPRPKECG